MVGDKMDVETKEDILSLMESYMISSTPEEKPIKT